MCVTENRNGTLCAKKKKKKKKKYNFNYRTSKQ
jgi:hypothetical protein